MATSIIFAPFTEDRFWVHDKQKENTARDCVYCRNIIAGHYIEGAIWESITSSYKSILGLSPNFLDSRWCEEEFRMAEKGLPGGEA